MLHAIESTTGLVLELIGVVLLFRFGMPFAARTGGRHNLVVSQVDEALRMQERRFNTLSWVGLVLIVFGTAAQIVPLWT
jgi:hypothetical protein